jgi:hypothetical protein
MIEREELAGHGKGNGGGGAIAHKFAAQIGADGYSGIGPDVVKLARILILGYINGSEEIALFQCPTYLKSENPLLKKLS